MTGTSCILIVEPDILVRHPLAGYLRDCGFTVAEAANAAEAMALLRHEPLNTEFVLADATAEPAAVFAMSQWIRSNAAQVHVILAGNVEKAVTQAGKLCNEGPALVKPYEHELVLDHIRRILAFRGEKQDRPCSV
jgi:DNA-binding NtrC family response regulator